MNKIRSGDSVVVIAGKDKGKRGTVRVCLSQNRLIVDGVNRVKKHVRPNPMRNEAGGIVEIELSVHASNVALLNPATGKADRVGFRYLEDGTKVRYYKSSGELVDGRI